MGFSIFDFQFSIATPKRASSDEVPGVARQLCVRRSTPHADVSSTNQKSKIKNRKSAAPGFTLVELLTAVGIIAVLAAITFPAIQAVTRSGQKESGFNTINVAVSVARVYAARPKANLDPPVSGAVYDGVALIFTPAGEMRIVENNQAAVDDNGNNLEPGRNGYSDITEAEYIELPRGTGVVGLTRGDNTYLYTPPFAIRFNRNGGLIVGESDDRKVFYDSDYNGQYVDSARFSGYNPNASDPRQGANTLHTNEGKHKLPFEQIETVVGVLVFSMSEFNAANQNLAASSGTNFPLNNNARDWLLQTNVNDELVNSKLMLFSRLTGHAMRE